MPEIRKDPDVYAGATALSWAQPARPAAASHSCAVQWDNGICSVFLETKEVNSVLCSKYKIDPACPPPDF